MAKPKCDICLKDCEGHGKLVEYIIYMPDGTVQLSQGGKRKYGENYIEKLRK
jgi:hypothetical protein